MAFQILLNALLAFTWMFMNDTYTASGFVSGYILGVVAIFMLRRFFPQRFYGFALYSIFKLVVIFIRELLLANLSVLKTILSPKLQIKPGIFAFRTDLKRDWEITVLANLITLTPGTLVIDISDDRSILYIHAMDIEDAEKAIHDIRVSFEKAIQEVSSK
ncbi:MULTISPECIES: Na+/H+ antiporter subunit E [unclassified Bacillus (in: firmicutes)]|uniref:Na+/H+ antiporter subunit E n=1 Tax=unclassified Bacillus (in: firmicutes) TaxID=185979 RepID=UPI000D0444E3|nr:MULTISPECIES: Na+/H+ antiporter subunit E [unclassified Bacillus (in: firmicutes)]PRR90843.1 Na+/H+ antiporter subunit E [Bacillus sp. NMCN1]PRR98621.1 Na+/H+ antiporter subunit E [Bacillus sp. NMCN6]